jgi:hypothetical protein
MRCIPTHVMLILSEAGPLISQQSKGQHPCLWRYTHFLALDLHSPLACLRAMLSHNSLVTVDRMILRTHSTNFLLADPRPHAHLQGRQYWAIGDPVDWGGSWVGIPLSQPSQQCSESNSDPIPGCMGNQC